MALEEKISEREFSPEGSYVPNEYTAGDKETSYALFLNCGCTPSCQAPSRCRVGSYNGE